MTDIDSNAASIVTLKNELVLRQAYLQLVYSLILNGITVPEIRETMLELRNWLDSASEHEIRRKSSILIPKF
jgi:hypothetical protein